MPFSYCYERADHCLGNFANAHTITDLRVSRGSQIALICKAAGAANDLRNTRRHNCCNEMIPRLSDDDGSADIDRDEMCFEPVHNVLIQRGESIRVRAVIFGR